MGSSQRPFVIARPEEISNASNDAKTAGAAALNVLASPILYAKDKLSSSARRHCAYRQCTDGRNWRRKAV